ncbi:hypothetical protein SAMN05421503_1466 [Terribacillus aidingensis]|uniref:Uncharacterized protein n=1 Tax=Terribacillus aidingensis TaxID=586416 RepID=A0A285NKI8_9BACI|nr:hypothetical protein [Terribacillus aidingensis]SNZ10012.1 hypothetical protein SAMN05421503_1466 [Terribacillus aidingensis]
MKDYQKHYNEFWKQIIEDSNGNVRMDQLMRELSEYSDIMKNATYVYSSLTPVSKFNTDPTYIVNYVNDTMIHREMAADDLEEMTDENGMVSLEDIQQYLST